MTGTSTKTPTGIHGLDAQLKGGLPTGATVLLLSPPTNAAQTFAVQFALAGLTGGQEVVYVNTDRPLEEVKAQMADLDDHLARDPEALEHLMPLDIFAERYDAVVEGHGLDKDVLRRVEKTVAKEREGPYRVVLDNLSFFVEKEGWADVRDFLEYAALSTRRGDGVLLVSMVKGLHDDRVEAYAKQLCDGWIVLDTFREGLQATPFLTIGKMRGTHLSNRVLPYEETDKGLWLETAMRVF